jgi:putative membrane protein
MKRVKLVLAGIFWLLVSWSGQVALANELITADFIQFASAKSGSEAAAAELALKTTKSAQVRAYAQGILDEQSIVQVQLESLAQQEGIVLDERQQRNAYVFIRKGETFDTAYAHKRAAELKRLVRITRKAMFSESPQVRAYAEQTLPVLMQRWYHTQQLVLALNNSTQPADTMVASR